MRTTGLTVRLHRMTSLSPRDVDLPLHDDVRRLAAALGRVILRLEGNDAFQTVETLRRDARARRRGDPDAPNLEQLLARVEALPLPPRVPRTFHCTKTYVASRRRSDA